MNGCITRRNLDRIRVDVVRETADQRRFTRQRKLQVAFGQCGFCSLPLGNVELHADKARNGALLIK